MAGKKRASVTDADKQVAIEKVKGGAKRADVAKEVGVSMATMNSWMAAAGGTRGKSPKSGAVSDDVELLKLEVEFLRKKVAYYEKKYGLVG